MSEHKKEEAIAIVISAKESIDDCIDLIFFAGFTFATWNIFIIHLNSLSILKFFGIISQAQ